MRRCTLPLLLLAAPLILSCDREPTQPSAGPADGVVTAAAAAAPDALVAAAEVNFAPVFDPQNFVRDVDNRFFPLPPGTRFVSEGEEDGEAEINVTLVTHDRKEILGVSAVVVLDRVLVDGEVKEKTFDWYAQDRDGNVWYLGEDTKEFEDGKVVSTAGSWEAGKNGAVAGIIMPAHPQVGQHYFQEFFRGEAEDQARVVARGLDVTVPFGTFHNCIKTVEFTRLEPGVKEAKFYCPGVGFVRAKGILGSEAFLVLKNVFR